MRKIVSSVAFAVSLLPLVAYAQQADNTVNFAGEVTSQTCDITINGEKTSPVVLLPTVADTALATTGATAGDTPFSIDLAKCNAVFARSKASFTGLQVTSDGNLGNTGSATNVEIQLLDGLSTNIIDFNGPSMTTSQVTISSAGNASIPLVVRYYASGTSTAGTVVAAAHYVMQYE